MMNKPKQYIQGYVEFYKLRFKVTPDVLIPRPETELLVDEVLDILRESNANREASLNSNSHNMFSTSSNNKNITILDLGTGAGNIAISLAKNLLHTRGVTIIATDVSKNALKVARKNAQLHGVEDRIIFLESDLLTSFCHSDPALPEKDDNLIIVTNLPYIPSARIPYLDSSVKDFEPHVALDGGEDGFELYRKLFQQIVDLKWHPKLIIGEIDYTHGESAIIESMKYFPEAKIEVKKDLTHMQRILLIRQFL